jgi:outer membrane protein assembly factor BamB
VTLKSGEASNAGIAWSASRGDLEMASPLVYQGHLYVLSQRGGFLTCYDVRDGKQTYRERLPDGDTFWASPWACDGKVFCLDQSGTTYVVRAGAEFQLLSVNRIEDQFWASAAVAGGSLILRGVDSIYCIKQ